MVALYYGFFCPTASYELNQLEEKLNESEQAVERILQTANKVIAEVYKREMEANESDSTVR